MKYNLEQEWEIRANLYIEDEEYNEYWEENKKDIYKVLSKNCELLKRENVRYCFTYDVYYDKENVEQNGNEFVILVEDNGIVIYKEKENTYGCDMCGGRKDFEKEIIWITSSYGLCEECYQKLTEEELKKIREEYE